MSVHFFHTSDWHLGQLFHQHSRHEEHAHFLKWLLEQIESYQPDALLIAGDLFDVVNPSSHAQKQLYQFLADAHTRCPTLQTLMIAGNHDSGYRIEQVEPLLAQFNAHAVGIIRWLEDGQLDTGRLIVPIHNKVGKVVAWCVTLPFLRAAEVTGRFATAMSPQEAIVELHQHILRQVHQLRQPDQAVIVMSHSHIQGGIESDSERRIVIGYEEALSPAIFTDLQSGMSADYVALGHLHQPQMVGSRHIRYSGSPIPLSFSEIHYPHQVLNVKIDRTAVEPLSTEALIIPRRVQLHRIACDLKVLFDQLKKLPDGSPLPLDERHFLHIDYQSDHPAPSDLRQQIEDCLPAQRYRLVRLSRQLRQQHSVDTVSKIDLAPPTPIQLFERIWQSMQYVEDAQVKADFMQLVIQAEHQVIDSNS